MTTATASKITFLGLFREALLNTRDYFMALSVARQLVIIMGVMTWFVIMTMVSMTLAVLLRINTLEEFILKNVAIPAQQQVRVERGSVSTNAASFRINSPLRAVSFFDSK